MNDCFYSTFTPLYILCKSAGQYGENSEITRSGNPPNPRRWVRLFLTQCCSLIGQLPWPKEVLLWSVASDNAAALSTRGLSQGAHEATERRIVIEKNDSMAVGFCSIQEDH